MAYCLLLFAADPAHWAGSIFQDFVAIVVGFQTLTLSCKDRFFSILF